MMRSGIEESYRPCSPVTDSELGTFADNDIDDDNNDGIDKDNENENH